MVDVGDKPKTERVAVATARLRMLPETRERILAGRIEKGDVLAAARLAGIMAAKRTPDFVPLCHPIALSGVEVTLTPELEGLTVRAQVKTVDRTGVEMEALTAACAAALTVYDMCKSVDRGMVLEAVQLEHKAGGRSGTWHRDGKGAREAPAKRTAAVGTGKARGEMPGTDAAGQGEAPASKSRDDVRSTDAAAPSGGPAGTTRRGMRGTAAPSGGSTGKTRGTAAPSGGPTGKTRGGKQRPVVEDAPRPTAVARGGKRSTEVAREAPTPQARGGSQSVDNAAPSSEARGGKQSADRAAPSPAARG
jgi:cyclic pyranopterin phosphate synthase